MIALYLIASLFTGLMLICDIFILAHPGNHPQGVLPDGLFPCPVFPFYGKRNKSGFPCQPVRDIL